MYQNWTLEICVFIIPRWKMLQNIETRLFQHRSTSTLTENCLLFDSLHMENQLEKQQLSNQIWRKNKSLSHTLWISELLNCEFLCSFANYIQYSVKFNDAWMKNWGYTYKPLKNQTCPQIYYVFIWKMDNFSSVNNNSSRECKNLGIFEFSILCNLHW